MDTQSWLKCSLGPGMFPNEYAVEVDTVESGRVSFFAQDYMVNVDRAAVRVDVYSVGESSALVRLPSHPYEVSSRVAKVPRAALVET